MKPASGAGMAASSTCSPAGRRHCRRGGEQGSPGEPLLYEIFTVSRGSFTTFLPFLSYTFYPGSELFLRECLSDLNPVREFDELNAESSGV
jgi:hypothetical protein